jgi:peptidoglycan/LPS O-acetylase OafA/YrhL
VDNKRVHFPGLNSIRSVAVLLVIITHIESFKNKSGMFSLFKVEGLKLFIENIGHQGVIMFFALSGFLITYLLLTENERTGTVDVKKFYIRRALRIWPLYFLIVILGFFVLPYIFNPSYFPVKTHPHLFAKLFLTVAFLPNAVLYAYGSIFTIGVLWSIGTEEQFYLIWPWLVRKVRKKLLPQVFIGILIAIVLLKVVLWLGIENYHTGAGVHKILFVAYHFLEYDAMLVGAFAAVIYYYKKPQLSLIYSKWTQIIALCLVGIMLFSMPDLGPVTNLVFASLYAVFILNISTNTQTIIKVVNPLFEFLGKISFGMYLYHSVCIAACLSVLNKFNKMELLTYNIALYILAISSTVIVSAISFYILEKPILNYKTGFMIVKSGSSAA